MTVGTNKLHLYATEKEITVSRQRLEVGFIDQESTAVEISDSAKFPRCCRLGDKTLSISLDLHPIHNELRHISHTIVYVPKTGKSLSYFKLRKNFRYVLTLLFREPPSAAALAMSVAKQDGTVLLPFQTFRTFHVETRKIIPLPPLPTTPLQAPPISQQMLPVEISLLPFDGTKIQLRALINCGPNILLETTFSTFGAVTLLDQRIQSFLVKCNQEEVGLPHLLLLMKAARYALHDLTWAQEFVEPNNVALNKQLGDLRQGLVNALNGIWQFLVTLHELLPPQFGVTEFIHYFLQDSYRLVCQLPLIFSRIVPLLTSIHDTPFAKKKILDKKNSPQEWPYGAAALAELQSHGFMLSALPFQPDRAVCRHCSAVAYAWHRLLPPLYFHRKTCLCTHLFFSSLPSSSSNSNNMSSSSSSSKEPLRR